MNDQTPPSSSAEFLSQSINRKQFLTRIGFTGVALVSLPWLSRSANLIQEEEPPPLDRTLVKEMVTVAHNNFDRAKELITEVPNLVNAAWDWRAGDFESALGAASHVGYKKLARLLIDHGARTNILTAALFGELPVVKGIIEVFPQALHTVGPHGFTLLHHAKVGGEEAAPVFEYLSSKGLKETHLKIW